MCYINLLTLGAFQGPIGFVVPSNGVEQEVNNAEHRVQEGFDVRIEASTTIPTTNAANVISNLDRKKKTPHAGPSSQPPLKQIYETNMYVPQSISQVLT